MALGTYYYCKSNQSNFSYLKDKKEIDQLADDLKKFRTPKQIIISDELGRFKELANPAYEAFLDKSNPYHILLSYKIQNDQTDQKLNELILNYEKVHDLQYSEEIEQILRTGSFDNFLSEEKFIINELTVFIPKEIINIIEVNLNREITKLNADESRDDAHFKFLIGIYIDQLRANEISLNEKRQLLDMTIKSYHIKKILNDYFESQNDETDLASEVEVEKS